MSRDDPLAHEAGAAVTELSQLWAAGTPPRLDDFLAGVPPLGPGQLVQLLAIDQAGRWRRGERVAAEEYFRRYPAVARDDEAALDLLYSEHVLRQEQGAATGAEELARRFPHLADRLRRLFQLEDFFADEPLDPAQLAELPEPRRAEPVTGRRRRWLWLGLALALAGAAVWGARLLMP